LFSFIQEISLFDYSRADGFLFGTLFALGQIFGDLGFAFLKRRIGLVPGAPFLPFDQTNYVIGCFLVLQPILKIEIKIWIFLFFATFFLHILVNRLGFHLKIHSAKW
ncbi:CDP-archaeol synthase, partial [Candidatus Parcubacteria bacterium]|nr:CDP-archaeol synthase [Candidatus Parcubacteria bacterium]